MAVLVDTDLVPPEDRVATWRAAIGDAILPMRVSVGDPHTLSGRVEAWLLGDLRLVRTTTNVSLAMALTQRQAAARDEPVFSVGLTLGDGARYEQFGSQRRLPRGGLHCVDLSSKFDYNADVGGASVSLTCMTAEQLGLPVDVLRRGRPSSTPASCTPWYASTRNLLRHRSWARILRARNWVGPRSSWCAPSWRRRHVTPVMRRTCSPRP